MRDSAERRQPAGRGGGFTLVELLVTTSLMALVGGATVGALSGGLRVWERATAFGTHEQSVLIASAQMRRDLQNVRPFRPIPFHGAYDQFEFAGTGPAGDSAGDPAAPGRVGYFLDDRRHVLCRSFVPYPRVRSQRLSDRCDAALEGVSRVRFSYFGAEPVGGSAGWSAHWDAAAAPMAVKAEVTVQAPGGPEAPHVFVIALAGLAPDAEAPAKP